MLRLNRNREMYHYNLGVVGSTGAGLIQARGAHDGAGASSGNGNYIAYSNQGASSYPIASSTTVTNGWHFVVWSYTQQQTTSTNMHGLSTAPVYDEDGLTSAQLYTNLQLVRDGHWGTRAVWALSCHGGVFQLDAQLKGEFLAQRSQWWFKIQPGTYTNMAYSAIGTSEHFILAEDLHYGNSSGDSLCEYHFGAQSWNHLGYSGYGPDYLKGQYARITTTTVPYSWSLSMAPGNSILDQDLKYTLNQGETLRFSGLLKVEDDSLRTGGYIQVKITEMGTSNVLSHNCYSNEFEEFEIYITKTTSNAAMVATIEYVAGTTTDGNGASFVGLAIHRCGYGTVASTGLTTVDQVVGGHTLAASDFIESVGPFKLGHPTDYLNFWSTSRNLYNPHYQNQYNTQGVTEDIRFFGHNYDFTDQYDAQKVMYMTRANAQGTLQHSYYCPGGSSVYEDINPDKMYFAGFWVRVHEMGTSVSQAPSRIQVLGNCKDSNGNQISMDDLTGTPVPTNRRFAFMSVYSTYANMNSLTGATNAGNDSTGWKLYGGFYLPSKMSDADVAKFHETNWQQWAGQYNVGVTAAASGYPGAVNELITTQLGRVARLPSNAAQIQTELSFELQSNVTINARVALPFMLEVDPLNFTEDGRCFFLDFFQQNSPAL